MSLPSADSVAARARAQVPKALADLCDYLRIPAISCEPAHAADVRALATRVASDLAALGFAEAQVRELDGALPIVTAEWMGQPGKPTILIYGHLDLQPVKGEVWTSPPHEPTVRDGRLYARGAADDMGGWVSHLAALRAWLEETGTLPANIKLVIEGEEEIGSPNLERYMDAFPAAFQADVMVLTDCENPSPEIPGLTTSLRGLMECTVRCEALEADIHSGLWGGMVPDVSLALVTLLARLVDENGRLKKPRADVPAEWSAGAWNVPLTTEVIRAGAHLCHGVEPLPTEGAPPAEHLWRQPAITVVATTLPTSDRKKNALRMSAEAILSVRVAPGQDDDTVRDALRAELLRDPPGGVKVTVDITTAPSGAWLYTPQGPAFPAADRAYVKAWGRPLLQVGVGGSIPFVALFGRRFGDLPLILNGVIDPQTTAHGPNESLHLGVFEKAILANVYLYEELGKVSALVRP
ncbi:MAG: M20/M25/M40 family metallo-hydrolase [Pseudomonadota bacterium]|nr:M20/M25/M40 family metallo-hydrolase [Pseudomonadota bacterium]